MPRYYLHIRTPNGVDRDPVGVVCRSLADARAFASQAVMTYVSDASDVNLELIATARFEIVNEEGRRDCSCRSPTFCRKKRGRGKARDNKPRDR